MQCYLAVNCGGRCVDLRVDPNNCGACGTACKGVACVNGKCAGCQAGLTDCNGNCVDLRTDVNNCAACGVVCTPPRVCTNGQCM